VTQFGSGVTPLPNSRRLITVVAAKRAALGAVPLERRVTADAAEGGDDLVDGHLSCNRFDSQRGWLVVGADHCQPVEYAVELLGEHRVNFVGKGGDPAAVSRVST
jgi:hypothetical protein